MKSVNAPPIPLLTMRIALLLFLFCGNLSVTLYAQPEPLTLEAAIQRGLANNYQIRIARAELEVAENNDHPALTGKRPTVMAGVSPGASYRNNTNPASIVSRSAVFNYNVTPQVGLNWVLFGGGRVRIARERLQELTQLGTAQLQLQVENSIAALINTYHTALAEQERVSVLEATLALSRDQIEYQNIRREFGQGGTFATLQARDAVLADSSNLLAQRAAFSLARQQLLQLMGEEDLDQKLVLTSSLQSLRDLSTPAALENALLSTNPQLQTLRLNERLAELDIRNIETEFKPSINLTAGASYDITVATGSQTFDFGGDQPPREQELPGIAARTLTGQLGVGVNYTLFDGGARSVRAQSARLAATTQRLNTKAVTLQLRTALTNALTRYRTQEQVIAITRQRVVNARQNVEIAAERLRGGVINSFDFRTVQLSLVNAEFQLLDARLDLRNTETEILRLVGGVLR